jgi:hypothetical protein
MNHFPPLWAKSAEAAVCGSAFDLRPAPCSCWTMTAPSRPSMSIALRQPPTLEWRIGWQSYPGFPGSPGAGLRPPRPRASRASAPSTRFEIWGSHGREQLKPTAPTSCSRLTPCSRPPWNRWAGDVSPGLFRSTGGQALLPGHPLAQLASPHAGADPLPGSVCLCRLAEPGGLHLLPFDGGLELRSTDRTKGTAVGRSWRKNQPRSRWPTWATISPMKTPLPRRNRGFSILVRTEVRESSARFWLRPPEELLGFLDEWIAASQEPAPAARSPVEASR